jgi:hypothetical protein
MHARPVLILLFGSMLALAGGAPAFAQADPFAQANVQDCQQEFEQIKASLDKNGTALKAAGQRKAQAQEMCQLLRRYTDVESRLIKFFVQKKTTCQIPDQIMKQAKDGHTKAIAMRTQVCQAAAGGAGAPPPPSLGLSGALGSSSTAGAPAEATPSGSGVFDTLTGNVLQR